MKKIKFNKLIIKNFLSVGNEEIEINFKNGFNIITGFNRDENNIRNGVGKSTILNAFYFAIFGSTTQNLPTQKMVVNRLNGKNCKVVLEFSSESSVHGNHDFRIERFLAPSKVRIFKDEVIKTKSTMAETNKYIKEVLSCSEEIFDNCVVMRANNTIPFMSRKKADKKNFIEMIFNLGIFGEMTSILKGDLREAKRNFDIETTSRDRYLENVNSYETEIINISKENELKEIKNKKEIEKLNQYIININNTISKFYGITQVVTKEELEKLVKDYKINEKKLNKLLNEKVSIKSDLEIAIRDVKKVQESGYSCPTCGREYDEKHLQKSKEAILNYKNIISSKKEELEKINNEIAKINDVLSKINNELIEKNKKIAEIKGRQRDIENGKNLIKSYKAQIKQLETITSDGSGLKRLQKLLEDARKLYTDKCTKADELQRRIGILNVSEHILGEQGVKAFVVSKLINILNSRIEYYLRSFKSTFTFTFDNFFEESLVDSYGIPCSYFNCSGAEAKKIDLALAFAFNDILKYQTGVEYNLTFFDEILDSSLDTKSLEIIIDFLSKEAIKNRKGLYVITHKDNLNMPYITETIVLEKTEGFTHRIR